METRTPLAYEATYGWKGAAPYPDVVRTLIWLLLVLVVPACTATDDSPIVPPPATRPTTAPTTTPPTTTGSAGTTLPLESACPEGDPFLNDGQLLRSQRPGADGRAIAGITWSNVGDCHVVTVSFSTEDGAPATTPPTMIARLSRAAGVLRIETEATSSVLVDQLVENGVVGSLFVPANIDGNRFIDLTLLEPVVARATLMTSPARLQIELQPGGSPDMGSPLITEQVIMVEPGSGAMTEPIVDVSGYSIGEVAPLELTLLMGEAEVESQVLELEPSPGLWLEFTTTIQIGSRSYDRLRVSSEDGTAIAGIPFSR